MSSGRRNENENLLGFGAPSAHEVSTDFVQNPPRPGDSLRKARLAALDEIFGRQNGDGLGDNPAQTSLSLKGRLLRLPKLIRDAMLRQVAPDLHVS
jgi:hypothetical protein